MFAKATTAMFGRHSAADSGASVPGVHAFSELCEKELGMLPARVSEGVTAAAFAVDESTKAERLKFERSIAKGFFTKKDALPPKAAAPADGRAEGVLQVVEGFFRCFWLAVVIQVPGKKLPFSFLESSWSFGVLSAMMRELLARPPEDAARRALASGGRLLSMAVLVLFGLQITDDEERPYLFPIVEWFGDRVCGELWGIKDPWGDCAEVPAPSPLANAARFGPFRLVQMIVAKGGNNVMGDPKGSVDYSPLVLAADRCHEVIFRFLLDREGVDVLQTYTHGWCLGARLFGRGGTIVRESRERVAALKEVRFRMMGHLLRTRPEVLAATAYGGDEHYLDILHIVISTGDTRLVEMVMASGKAVIWKKYETKMMPDGSQRYYYPTVGFAINNGGYEVTALLVNKYDALDGWKDEYDVLSRERVAIELSIAAVCSFTPHPDFKGVPESPACPEPSGLRTMELLLSKGFDESFQVHDQNAILSRLYPASEDCCRLVEKDALFILRRYHAAGLNVTHMKQDGFAAGQWTDCLPQLAAAEGQRDILDFAVKECGCPLDFEQTRENISHTALSIAISEHQVDTVLHILRSYKPKVAYPGLPSSIQPLSILLGNPAYTDSQAARVLRLLIERDKGLLSVEPYQHDATSINPMLQCVAQNKDQCLELLLNGGLDGACEMAKRTGVVADFEKAALNRMLGLPEPLVNLSPAQAAASTANWNALSLLLRYTDCSVTKTYPPIIADEGGGGRPHSSVAETILRAKPAAPRTLLAEVMSRAKREKESEASTAVGAGSAGAPPARATFASNAFEDPSMSAVAAAPKSSKKGKKKAKKRTHKKQKGQKQGAASSGADTDSSDGEEEPFDEPDDNLVDSRNAPSLDAMFAAMGLPPGGGTAPDESKARKE